jgi:superfamily II DNA or RNA helicase
MPGKALPTASAPRSGKPASGEVKPPVPKITKTHKPEGMELEEWQRLLRRDYGVQQNFILTNTGDHPVFSDFSLTNPQTGKTYRLAIRGEAPGANFCSCPDYRINNLGTCKHVEFTLATLKSAVGAAEQFRNGYEPPYSEVYLSYGPRREIRFRRGATAPVSLITRVRRFFDANGVLKESRLLEFPSFLQGVRLNGHEVRWYDDVMAFIAEYQDAAHRRELANSQLAEGIESPVFATLLKTELFPYQREGALFAVTAGRCLLGDDMGLGKTIQALAAAELMARLYGISKVLIISPTSLKHQWKSEIEKFTDRTAEVIEGLNFQRAPLYQTHTFFKLLNYELVHRDLEQIREWGPDLIILDEAQRIKNWKTRTAMTVKQLQSTFAIVLTGTPLENRIEELHSLMEFVDCHHLGPLYRFVHNHRVVDGGGKVIGYRNLESVRKSLKGVMIRRKKSEVLKQLPERLDKNLYVPMTTEQGEIHEENRDIVAKLVYKWRKFRFLCEADQKRMQVALARMRMAADNTYLVDHETVFGPKLDELATILDEQVLQGGEKVVVFSQWLRMTELVEQVLARLGIGYVHLNGSVPSKSRKGLMTRFKEDPDCRVFLSTDAGGVGLNLQSGSVVVNLDIPWNPAILEQRIARVHRMGQMKGVRVINMVSIGSIEERILDLIRFKRSLFAGALDDDGADTVMVGESQLESFMNSVEDMTDPLTPPDFTSAIREQEEEASDEAEAVVEEQREATAATVKVEPAPETSASRSAGSQPDALSSLIAGGARFLTSLSEALAQPEAGKPTSSPEEMGQRVVKALGAVVARDESTGKSCLKIPLPEPDVLQGLFAGLGQVLAQVRGKR